MFYAFTQYIFGTFRISCTCVLSFYRKLPPPQGRGSAPARKKSVRFFCFFALQLDRNCDIVTLV